MRNTLCQNVKQVESPAWNWVVDHKFGGCSPDPAGVLSEWHGVARLDVGELDF